MEKTLYQACKEFVNKVGAGNEFKTKEFTNEVGDYCTPTRWNLSNNNPYYRAHTYKTFFKNAGIITQIKRGLWKVNAPIPENVTLTDFQYDTGYTTAAKWDGEYRTSKVYKVKNNPFDFKKYLESFKQGKQLPKIDLGKNIFNTENTENSQKDAYFASKSELDRISEKVQNYIKQRENTENTEKTAKTEDFDDVAANKMLTEAFDDILEGLNPGDTVWTSNVEFRGSEIESINLRKEKVLEISITKTINDIKIELKTDKKTYDEVDILDVFKTLDEAVSFLEIKVDALQRN